MVLMKLSNILGDFFAYRNAEKEGIGLCKNYGQDFFRWKISAIASYYRLVLFCHSPPCCCDFFYRDLIDINDLWPRLFIAHKKDLVLLIKTYTPSKRKQIHPQFLLT